MSDPSLIGFRCLAGPYGTAEMELMGHVLADLARGGIAYRISTELSGLYIWRSDHGWRDEPGPVVNATNSIWECQATTERGAA